MQQYEFAVRALFVVIFVFIASLSSAVSYARTGAGRGWSLKRRIEGMIDADARPGDGPTDESLYGRAVRPVLSRYRERASSILGRRGMNSIQTMLLHAGLSNWMDAEEFAAAKVVATVVFGAGLGLLALAEGRPNMIALYMVIGAAVGWFGPDFWLKGRLKARQDEISAELAQWIPSLRAACIAGASIDAAISDLVRDAKDGVLAREFAAVDREVQYGEPIQTALRRMAGRNGNADLSMMVETILTTTELGTNVAELLINVSSEIKKRGRAAKMELVKKAPIKMLFPMLFLIFPATFIIMLGPSISRFSHIF